MTDADARARRLGWRPPEEWNEGASKGKRRPARFLSAEEYIEKCETDLPVLRERLRWLETELAERDDLIAILHEKAKGIAARLRDSERDRLAVEHGVAREAPAPNGHSPIYDDLSDEEKADCDRFLRSIPGLTPEEWFDMYRPRA